jgi:hypothetical protein
MIDENGYEDNLIRANDQIHNLRKQIDDLTAANGNVFGYVKDFIEKSEQLPKEKEEKVKTFKIEFAKGDGFPRHLVLKKFEIHYNRPYEHIDRRCETSAENGKLGGRPKKIT